MKKILQELPSYEIHSDGRIWSNTRKKFLKPYSQKKGHKRIMLINSLGKKEKFLVHRLVAKCFVENRDNKPFVCHIDSDPSNNDFRNLRWDDNYGNMQDRKARGLYPDQKGEKNYSAKLTENEVVEIKNMLKKYSPYKLSKLGFFKKVSCSTLGDINSGRSWSHVN